MNYLHLLKHERGLIASALVAGGAAAGLGVPIDFVLFGLMLAGIALFHHHTLGVALTGLTAIVAYELASGGLATGPGVEGLVLHLGHEWVTLANLLGLLLGFALLAQHFEDSNVPSQLPRILPSTWHGSFLLLAMVFVLSSFLDNIAAALIGGAMAHAVFRGKVHIGYLAAIVAASNAGGSGSVIGDTTTTMMWIDGVSPAEVVHAYVAAVPALFVCGIVAAHQQHKYAPIVKDGLRALPCDWPRVGVVVFTLAAVIAANVVTNLRFPALAEHVPVVGLAACVAILVATPMRQPAWRLLPGAIKNSAFLLALVLAASMMPVEQLPSPSWQSALGLGFVSAVFDNIPLTALALSQGGYDWGLLAYAVGYGGSMIWFGSSAGVALSSTYPEAKSVARWLTQGWHVTLAYVAGFFVLLAVLGWQPVDHGEPGGDKSAVTTTVDSA
jgi:Na+/H+ antiporter NhaD/arsenite permease-like protein